MKPIRPAQVQDHLTLLGLGAVWGSAFLCISIALRDFPPLSIAAIRIAIGALALLLVTRLRGLPLPGGGRTWALLLVIGALNSSVPFSLISFGQQSISSGTSAMLISTAPFAALAVAHWLTHDDRISRRKLVGLILGFSGVLVLVGPDVLASRNDAVSGQLMVLLAAFCYGSSSILIRRISHIDSLVSSAAVLLVTSAYFLPLALYLEAPWRVSPEPASLMALVYLGLVPTAFAYLLRFWLINRAGTVYVSQVSYLVPLFALFWGWLFLSEVPDQTTWLALMLILAGIAANSWPRRRSVAVPEPLK
ncbi:MAG: DMT family transporter [Gammaproteobacteria bacterium]|nr:DMT family transporter [Gammaproteobacteria bacterium]